MKYLFLIYENVSQDEIAALAPDEQQALYAAWGELNRTPGITPGVWMGDAATATTVRQRDGEMLTTDGPYPETKEALGGYFLFEADDLDGAIELASRVPNVARGGAVEIRPVVGP